MLIDTLQPCLIEEMVAHNRARGNAEGATQTVASHLEAAESVGSKLIAVCNRCDTNFEIFPDGSVFVDESTEPDARCDKEVGQSVRPGMRHVVIKLLPRADGLGKFPETESDLMDY